MSKNVVAKLWHSINHSTHASDLLDKLGEVVLDKVLDNELIKDIPIIGTAVTLLKAGDDFRAHVFVKKITCFLKEIEKVSVEEREEFYKKRCETPEKLSELGESTLMALDKIDHPTFAEMYGRAFALMLKNPDHRAGEIVFEQHIFAIKNLTPYLLRAMEMVYQSSGSYGYDPNAAQALGYCGLMSSEVRILMISDEPKMMVVNDRIPYGRFFYRRIIKGFPD